MSEKFSKKSQITILLLLIILNIALRIPTSPNELGVDSFKIHSYANIISENGFADWVIHPLSAFGMYPFSTPIGIPFLQSGISQSTGLEIKHTILLTSIIIGIIGVFASYIMAKCIKNDDLFAFLISFCFSLSPLFLRNTIWTTSERNLFIVLVPVFIWSLLKCYNAHQNKWKYILLTVMLFVMLGMTHRMVLMIIPIIISYFISLIIKYTTIEFYISKNKINLRNYLIYLYLITYVFFIMLQGFRLFFYKDFNIWWKYQSGSLLNGDSALVLIGNLIIDYISSVGILSIFMIIGIIAVLKNPNRNYYQTFLLITLLSFAPIIMLGIYTPLVLLSFFCISIAYGILSLTDFKLVKGYEKNLFAMFILVSTIFSIFMLWHWGVLVHDQKAEYLHKSTENAGIYLKNNHSWGSSFVSNDDENARRISAVSQIPYPLPDTAYVFNFVNVSDLKRNSSLSLSSITQIIDSDYKTDIDYRKEYRGQQSLDVDSNSRKEYNSKYKIRYVVQGKSPTSVSSVFYSSVTEKKSKIYDNNELGIWYIGGA